MPLAAAGISRGVPPAESSRATRISDFCAMNSAWSHIAVVIDNGALEDWIAPSTPPPVLPLHYGPARGLQKPGRAVLNRATSAGRPRSGLITCHHRGAAQLWAPAQAQIPHLPLPSSSLSSEGCGHSVPCRLLILAAGQPSSVPPRPQRDQRSRQSTPCRSGQQWCRILGARRRGHAAGSITCSRSILSADYGG